MVQFIDVDPNEIDFRREGRRGRVSYPILKGFLETNKYLVMLDRTGMQQSFQSLYSCLTSYIRNHELPIKLFSRSGQLYLMRVDIDKDGNAIEDWKARQATEGKAGDMFDAPAVLIDDDEVQRRFQEEKDKVTK